MNMMMRANVSQFLRDLNVMTSGPNSIYARGELALRQALLEDFTTMVRETPQYSGSTAASWRIGFYAPTEYTMMPVPASAEEALSRGMEPAVSYAVSEAMGSLGVTGASLLNKRQDITITNGAPGFETSEFGPVRPINEPAGPLSSFIKRFSSRTIIVDFKQ